MLLLCLNLNFESERKNNKQVIKFKQLQHNIIKQTTDIFFYYFDIIQNKLGTRLCFISCQTINLFECKYMLIMFKIYLYLFSMLLSLLLLLKILNNNVKVRNNKIVHFFVSRSLPILWTFICFSSYYFKFKTIIFVVSVGVSARS